MFVRRDTPRPKDLHERRIRFLSEMQKAIASAAEHHQQPAAEVASVFNSSGWANSITGQIWLCVCVLTTAAQIITATHRDL